MITCKIHYIANDTYEFKTNKDEILNENGFINHNFTNYIFASTSIFNFVKSAHSDILKMEWGYLSITLKPSPILSYKHENEIDLEIFNKINIEFIRLLNLMAFT